MKDTYVLFGIFYLITAIILIVSMIVIVRKHMKNKYNNALKMLERDKIPEIIKNNNEEPITRILNDEEYKIELEKKLLEEYNEVLNATGGDYLEELADMLEVIDALAITQNKTLEDILKIKESKAVKRGGFKNKIFLESTK